MDFTTPEFWIAVGQIILIDILLGGDNAVVIALASRRLPEAQRKRAIFWGMFGAVGLRVALIYFALELLRIPFLKIGGGLLLLWIGVKLLAPPAPSEGQHIGASTHLLGAIRTIILADAVMSLDNIIGIAAAARDHPGLVVFGLLISVPIIVFGSRFVLTLMDRFPIIITGGAALLGWIAGDMVVHDVAVKARIGEVPGWLVFAAAGGGAILVVLIGWTRRRPPQVRPAEPVDLVHRDHEEK